LLEMTTQWPICHLERSERSFSSSRSACARRAGYGWL